MSNVVSLGFPEVVKHVGIRLSAIEQFNAASDKNIFDPRIPSDKQDLDWLDKNAPGWSLQVNARSLVTRDLPIGPEATGAFLFHEVRVIFRLAAQRAAWREYVAQLQADHKARQERYQQAVANAPEGVVVCHDCAGHMEPIEDEETGRVAQFAFRIRRRAMHCAQCRVLETTDSCDHVIDAMEEARPLVGIPHPSDAHSTEATVAEWHRRRLAPPQATLEVRPEMTASEIVDALKQAIKAASERTDE